MKANITKISKGYLLKGAMSLVNAKLAYFKEQQGMAERLGNISECSYQLDGSDHLPIF